MRTKTLETIIDRVFWAFVLCLPMFAYLILCIHFETYNFVDLLNQFSMDSNNLVYTTLAAIFGTGGYLPYFDTTTVNPLLLYMSYFVCVELVHIIVDILLFIPKVCVAILDKTTKLGRF